MEAELFETFIKVWGGICLVCTYVLRVLPTPNEIAAKPYLIFFNIVRRFAGNKGWTPSR